MSNKLIAGLVAVGLVLLFFPRLLRKVFSGARRRRSVRRYVPSRVARVRSAVKRHYNKAGKRLKAWQIKGSLAARRHMAQIRRKRA